ncbi:MAG: tyrosine recombinase [Elusimicrobiaceae bacterium]|jgi:integrase/recombinase XerD|nr:tyrosine recombinase [Elusimicrobiaceae bacterium]MBT3955581.1 tyrosine recombinase [Elusimicrobiaceae bacterium]MBT4008656.1 tyrosine recombinase [Elusimicrobiaceae bacterium]MBT4402736.1 tyrosine recombinase [Elusimicrobiaceae bacterium]MBT4439629.1 tyrosine recombinase [Elusimicrobiaceae bacterium]
MNSQKLLENYKDYLTLERQVSKNTFLSYFSDIKKFLAYCDKENLNSIKADNVSLDKYFWHLKNQKLSPATIFRNMGAVKNFYKYLMIDEKISKNPTETLRPPKLSQKIPKNLTMMAMEKLLNFKPTNFNQLRTLCMIELLYGAGIRVSELINLQLEHVNIEENWLIVFGKGSKQRMVPMNKKASTLLIQYLIEREKKFINKSPQSEVFLNNRGEKISRVSIWKDLNSLAKFAGVSAKVHPHLFRHTFASHILEGGADLRSVQEMLGHVNITTTQIYTHIDKKSVKRKHENFHPRSTEK